MKNIKKTLLITSIATLVLSCLLLILAIFGVKVFEGTLLRVLLISSTLAIGCGIGISELDLFKRNKWLGIVSLSALCLSVLLALISFCSNLLFAGEIFNRITGIIAILSVLFAIIVSLHTKMGQRLFPIQIVAFASLSLTCAILILLIAGIDVFSVPGLVQIFGVLCVVSVGFMITISVLSKKEQGQEKISNKMSLKNENAEIEQLKTENLALKQEIEELKAKLEKYEQK